MQVNETTAVNSLLGVSSTTTGGATTEYLRDNRGNLVSERTPDGAYHYYLFDGLGSVVGVTSATGALEATCAYDPYGSITGSSGDLANPFRFASGYLDSTTGYTKFGARYDDTTLGRWTQQAGPLTHQVSLPLSC